MIIDNIWIAILLFGFGGFGVGIGLLVGAYVIRTLRRYMRDEDEPKQP